MVVAGYTNIRPNKEFLKPIVEKIAYNGIIKTIEGINLYEIGGDVAYRLKNSVAGQIVGFDDSWPNIATYTFLRLQTNHLRSMEVIIS